MGSTAPEIVSDKETRRRLGNWQVVNKEHPRKRVVTLYVSGDRRGPTLLVTPERLFFPLPSSFPVITSSTLHCGALRFPLPNPFRDTGTAAR